MQGRNWTPEQKKTFDKLWGNKSTLEIAEAIGKSENAIIVYAKKNGYPAIRDAANRIILQKLAEAMGVTWYTVRRSWVKLHGMPAYEWAPRGERKFLYVDIDDFWDWAKQHKDLIDFSRSKKDAFGIEPLWVDRERYRDKYDIKGKGNGEKWPEDDTRKLIKALHLKKYTYDQLARHFKRTEAAVKRKIYNLKKEGQLPVDLNPIRKPQKKWEPWEDEAILKWRAQRVPLAVIARKLNRTEIQVTGRYERLDDPDNGKRDYRREHSKAEVKKQINQLLEVLRIRRNQMAFDGYWQKEMCMHWDNSKGCKACQANCDDCTEFLRIKEQYCVRCGATFFKREKAKICDPCAVARKKQHQRKWVALNKKGKAGEKSTKAG